MRRIEPYFLWLGNVGDARNLRAIFDAGISVLIDLADNEPPAKVTRDLVYCRFPLLDGADNPHWLLRVAIETTVRMLRERIPTLLYCSAGMSRSPAIAAAALALTGTATPQQCLLHVLNGGPVDLSPSLWRAVCEVSLDLRSEESSQKKSAEPIA